MSQTLLINATLACVDGDTGYGLRETAAILIEGSTIAWLGPMSECPSVAGAEIVDCENRLVTPGLIDCHSHLVYGGDRADEFELRLEGASYAEIAQRGGGIVSTVNATRLSSRSILLSVFRSWRRGCPLTRSSGTSCTLPMTTMSLSGCSTSP